MPAACGWGADHGLHGLAVPLEADSGGYWQTQLQHRLSVSHHCSGAETVAFMGLQSHAVFIILVFLSQNLYQSPFARFLFNHNIRRIPASFLLLKAIDLPI